MEDTPEKLQYKLESAQRALAEAEVRLKHMEAEHQAAKDGILILDSETGKIIDANPYLLNLLSYNLEDISGKALWETNLIADKKINEETSKKLASEKHIRYDDLSLKSKDGQLINVAFVSSLYAVGNHNVIQCNMRRKTSDFELHKKERQLSEVLKIAKIGYWEYEFSTDEVVFNDQYYSLHKMSAEEAGGYRMPSEEFTRRYVHPEDTQTLAQAFQLALKSTDPDYFAKYETRLFTGDGETVWVEMRFRIEKDAQGRTIKLIGINQDITERKNAERVLRTSEKRFKNIFDRAPLGIALIDSIDGHIYEVNSHFAEVAGRTMEAMKNIDWQQLTHPDDIQPDLDNMALLNAGKINGFQMEKRYLHLDGSVVWINMTVSPLDVEDKEHPRHLCMIQDITERKQSEQAILSEKAFSNTMFESLPGIAFLLDSQGDLIRWNKQLEKLTPVPPEKMLKRNALEFFHKEDQTQIADTIQKALATGSAATEGRMLFTNGVRDYLLTSNRLDTHLGVTLIGFGLDITERKQTEEQLRSTMQSLNERLKEIQCLYNISTLTGDDALTVEQVIQGVVESIPQAFQYPEITSVRIRLADKQYKSENFKETPWRLAATIEANSDILSEVEVFYQTKKPIHDEGPFLNEEVTLIRVIAQTITDFLKARQAELALRKEEEKFRALVETTSDWIWELNWQGYYTYVSPHVEKLLGYQPQEVLGKSPFDFMPLKEAQRIGKAFENCIEQRAPIVSLENTVLHKDGTPRILETNGIPFFNESGELLGYRGVDRDITERKQAEKAINRANRALKTLSAGNELLVRATNEEALLQAAANVIVEQSGYELAEVYYADDNQEKSISLMAWSSIEDSNLWAGNPTWADTEGGQLPIASAIRSGTPQILQNIATENTFIPWRDETLARGHLSNIALPLIKDSKAFGALSIYSSEADAFDADEVRLLKELADDLSFGIHALRTQEQHRQAEKQIVHQAFYDSLTNLPNRAMIMQALDKALAKARRDGGGVAILFIDLDDFKLINDTLGHAAGDELLCLASERIKRATRQEDTVARQGGDEFIILLERYSKPLVENELEQESASIAQRILEALQEPFLIQDQEIYVSASIGISLLTGDDENSIQLLEHADNAMYKAKNLGRANYQYYSKELSERQHHKMLIATQLHKAIEQREFILHYQPVVDLTSGHMVGVEALIRWKQENGNWIRPDEFLPIAEDTGLILPISDWVVEEACQQIKTWSDKAMSLHVAVNLSVRQMWHGNIAKKLIDTIQEADIPIKMIEFEITESAMASDPKKIETVLQQLNQYGIRIALDDFGTGYSSLSRLKQLPISILKIDKSFVDGIPNDADDMAIVDATIKMASSLGLDTLAEGVETAEQWSYLQSFGCNYAQGYYFSRPVSASKIEALYQSGHTWHLNKDS